MSRFNLFLMGASFFSLVSSIANVWSGISQVFQHSHMGSFACSLLFANLIVIGVNDRPMKKVYSLSWAACGFLSFASVYFVLTFF